MIPTTDIAQRVAQQLAHAKLRIVLAESCTAGNVAGSLAVVPGISAHLCGSFVVYRNESKARWLGIDRQLLDDPEIGPVSSHVTRLLAQAALQQTDEADLAAAVTGHIGPGSPLHLDGSIFFCLANRHSSQTCERSTRLTSPAPSDNQDLNKRSARLIEATQWVLQEISQALVHLT